MIKLTIKQKEKEQALQMEIIRALGDYIEEWGFTSLSEGGHKKDALVKAWGEMEKFHTKISDKYWQSSLVKKADLPVGTLVRVTPFGEGARGLPHKALIAGYDISHSKYHLRPEFMKGHFTDQPLEWAFPLEVKKIRQIQVKQVGAKKVSGHPQLAR